MRYLLPYAFARSHSLLLEENGHALTLWHNASPDAGALGEVMRKYASHNPALVLQRADAGTLAQRISVVYAEGESSAAAVANEVESDADLSRMMRRCRRMEINVKQLTTAPLIAITTGC